MIVSVKRPDLHRSNIELPECNVGLSYTNIADANTNRECFNVPLTRAV